MAKLLDMSNDPARQQQVTTSLTLMQEDNMRSKWLHSEDGAFMCVRASACVCARACVHGRGDGNSGGVVQCFPTAYQTQGGHPV